jgi:CheY-like chemotaxis protein
MAKRRNKILVIDDEQTIRRLLELLLEVSDFSVRQADTLSRARELIKDRRPDLIICDIMLNEESGYDLYWELSEAPQTASIPFIFISAYPEVTAPERERISQHQGTEAIFLAKLFSPQELLQAIGRALRQRNGESQ